MEDLYKNKPTFIKVTNEVDVDSGLCKEKIYQVIGWNNEHPMISDKYGRAVTLWMTTWETIEVAGLTNFVRLEQNKMDRRQFKASIRELASNSSMSVAEIGTALENLADEYLDESKS